MKCMTLLVMELELLFYLLFVATRMFIKYKPFFSYPWIRFCRGCLNSLANKTSLATMLTCPLCCKVTALTAPGEQGVRALSKNFALIELIGVLHSAKILKEKVNSLCSCTVTVFTSHNRVHYARILLQYSVNNVTLFYALRVKLLNIPVNYHHATLEFLHRQEGPQNPSVPRIQRKTQTCSVKSASYCAACCARSSGSTKDTNSYYGTLPPMPLRFQFLQLLTCWHKI